MASAATIGAVRPVAVGGSERATTLVLPLPITLFGPLLRQNDGELKKHRPDYEREEAGT